jgi:hypothetical protein
MKRILIFLVGSIMMQPNVFAQAKTSFGDDVASLDGIMKAYYDVVSVKAGGKISFERDSLLHYRNVMVGLTTENKNKQPVIYFVTLKQYHQMVDSSMQAEGFYEKEISRKVEHFGSIYNVWSTYETRRTQDGPVIERGINSVQLFYDGKRFWITSWIFDTERDDNRIPSKYLSSNE